MNYDSSDMNSNSIKVEVSKYFLWKRQFVSCATEVQLPGLLGYSIADVIVFNKKHISYEIEVKVNRSDFIRELKVIEQVLLRDNATAKYSGKDQCKFKKHDIYLNTYMDAYVLQKVFAPNYFCFAVTAPLRDLAIKRLEGLPYGIICVNHHSVKVIKRAKRLHKKTLEEKYLLSQRKKLSNENLNLRIRLYGGHNGSSNLED